MPSFFRRLLRLIRPQGIQLPGAELYDFVARSAILQTHYERVAEDISTFAARGRLLDIGTGPGALRAKIRLYAPNLRLLDMDVSWSMNEKARRGLSGAELADDIAMCQADAHRLPLADESIEIVVSVGSLRYFKDPIAGLNEIHRVLKKGGAALMYDLVARLPDSIKQQATRDLGRVGLSLLWPHSFEKPFTHASDMESLAADTRFEKGTTRFVGVLCRLTLIK
jgi:ubiquinone/menaquinone biosynthesis C-methylase UbiE